MTKRVYSKAIKKRFIQAVESVVKENYPSLREADILRELGFMPMNYYRLRSSAEGNYPTLDQCFLLCDNYSISAEWLIAGRGSMKYINSKTLAPLKALKNAVSLVEEELKKKSAPQTNTQTKNKKFKQK